MREQFEFSERLAEVAIAPQPIPMVFLSPAATIATPKVLRRGQVLLHQSEDLD
jgi:hypothetical protein